MASEGRLPVSRVTSPFRAETTAGSRRTHSVDRSPTGSRISWAYWWPKSLSDRVLFHRSTIPWSRWEPTRPRLTSTVCIARSWLTSPINSRPGSTCSSLGHVKGPRLYMRDRASATPAAPLVVSGSASLYREATSTTVRAYYRSSVPRRRLDGPHLAPGHQTLVSVCAAPQVGKSARWLVSSASP